MYALNMIKFLTVSTFRKRIEALLKIKRGVYQNINKEISREFIGKSIEEIRNNRDMILISNEFIVIKLRLPDKKQRLSKKDGYRLIYLVSKRTDNVVFLDVYPKNGPSQQLNISDDNLAVLLDQFALEANEGLLIDFAME